MVYSTIVILITPTYEPGSLATNWSALPSKIMSCSNFWTGVNEGDTFILIQYLSSIESAPGCKLRRLYTDWFAWCFAWGKLNGCFSEYKYEVLALTKQLPEFLEDVLEAELQADKDTIPDPSKHKHRYYENPAFKPDDEMGNGAIS